MKFFPQSFFLPGIQKNRTIKFVLTDDFEFKIQKIEFQLTKVMSSYIMYSVKKEVVSLEIRDFFTEEHMDNLPTVRIKRIRLKNFKSVAYGEIVFNCGRQFIPYGTESDILGLYGQNGSGKTSLIESLSILKHLLTGNRIPDEYADCIAVDMDDVELEFAFDLQYPNGEKREAIYHFCMKKSLISQEERQERSKGMPDDYSLPEDLYKVIIFNESIKLSWNEDGAYKRSQLIIDSSTEDAPFGPPAKRKLFVSDYRKAKGELEISKRLAGERSQSFIFRMKTIEVFRDFGSYSIFFQILLELSLYGNEYLFVVDTKSSGFIRFNWALPIYTPWGRYVFDAVRPIIIADEELVALEQQIEGISVVLTQIVPGLSIGFKKISSELMEDGKVGNVVMLIANRGGKEMPMRCESDGVRKIISVLSLITAAYNQQSITVAIDELDAGVFEYLLGEILQIFEESGKGQLIFTSHNLRPLEVIDKKYLCFTTTNSENRYIRLQGVGASNNLRNLYLREILVGEQEEEIYSASKKHKIMAALLKAGIAGGFVDGK